MPMRRSAIVLALLLPACRVPSAPDPTDATPVASSAAVAPVVAPSSAEVDRRLELRVLGRTIGTMALDVEPTDDGGSRWTTRTELTLALDDAGETPKRIETDATVVYDAKLAMRSGLEITHEAGVQERKTVTIEGDTLTLRVQGPAHDQTHRFPIPEDHRSDAAVFEQLRREVEGGAAMPRTLSFSSFDDDELRFSHDRMTLLARVMVRDGDRDVPGWKIERRDEHGERTVAVLDAAGLPLSLEIGVFTAALPGTPAGEAGARLSSMLAIEGVVPRQAATLQISLDVPGDDDTEPLLRSGPYQDVTRDGNHYTLTLHARAGHGVASPKLPMTTVPDDVRRFLSPTPTSQSDEPAIVARAQTLARGHEDARAAAHAIVRWVFETLGKKDGARGAATATEVLADGFGDCTEHAALSVALLRAAGIPARNVSGVVLVPGLFSSDAGYHAWVEAWLGEWVVLDPALGNTDVSAHYILLGYDEPGLEQGGAALSRMLGRTTIRVLPR
ncbi:MAG: transglutaminase domain-containing protein [Deltaproteobacteria bacterium]|nr:transglutaminase domain-containing protein [Deltaproteobacteria bacterium]